VSVLKSIESRIAGLVEGTFSRAFRSEVRPVEIARRLAREMEEHKTVSVSRTYVPNEYTVWLSAQDRRRVAGYEQALRGELAGYLLEHARRERLALLTSPAVSFATDEQLGLGEFGIQARLVHPDEDPASAPRQGEGGRTMVYSAAGRLREPLSEPMSPRPAAALLVDGRRVALGPEGAVLGRSRECDVVLGDQNVSRRHAEVRPSGGSWVIADLGSTNGVRVNGRPVSTAQSLQPGDAIELGGARVLFELG